MERGWQPGLPGWSFAVYVGQLTCLDVTSRLGAAKSKYRRLTNLRLGPKVSSPNRSDLEQNFTDSTPPKPQKTKSGSLRCARRSPRHERRMEEEAPSRISVAVRCRPLSENAPSNAVSGHVHIHFTREIPRMQPKGPLKPVSVRRYEGVSVGLGWAGSSAV